MVGAPGLKWSLPILTEMRAPARGYGVLPTRAATRVRAPRNAPATNLLVVRTAHAPGPWTSQGLVQPYLKAVSLVREDNGGAVRVLVNQVDDLPNVILLIGQLFEDIAEVFILDVLEDLDHITFNVL